MSATIKASSSPLESDIRSKRSINIDADTETKTENGPLVTFQVAEPVVVPAAKDKGQDCVRTVLLMKHVFAFSYGKPFVGMFMISYLLLKFHFHLQGLCCLSFQLAK